MAIHVTPIPKLTDFATPGIVLGTAAAAGSAETVIRSDSTIVGFDTTIPSSLSLGNVATTGSAVVSSRRDHTHGTVDILLRVVTGEYSGDAAATQAIDELGITPSFICINKKSTGGGNGSMYQSYASMLDDNAAGCTYAWGAPTVHGAIVLDHVVSFDADGFTVGDDATQGSVNGSGNVYNFVCIGY